MAYWLVKSEPYEWSWEDHVKKGIWYWDGVRNYQARNNMKAMKNGDLAFFYHSAEERRIVGILEVAREHYPDPADETGRFCLVDFKAVKPLPAPVSLAQIKAHEGLSGMALVRQSRLSVSPVSEQEWAVISKMAGL